MRLDLVIDEVARPWRPGAEVLALAHEFVESVGPPEGELLVVVSDDRRLREHNREYRGIDKPTDVLSFSYMEGHEGARQELLAGGSSEPYRTPSGEASPLLGEVLISIETLRGRDYPHVGSEDGEVLFLMTHGLLHVLGFDHASEDEAEEMEGAEQRLFDPLRSRLMGGSS